MRNNLNLIIFIFSTLIVSSQNNFGIVTYKYELNEKEFVNNSKEETYNKVVTKLKKSLKSNSSIIRYKLEFNNNFSSYRLEERINVENENKLNYAILITGGQEEFFVDLEKDELLRKTNLLGDTFLIKSKYTKKWKLINEKKQIGGFTCYKAVLLEDEKENLNINTIAWYSPENPMRFGPKGYGNLPGLILELKIGPITYSVVKIELNPKQKLNIIKPKNGKLVNEEYFNEILRKIDNRKRKQ